MAIAIVREQLAEIEEAAHQRAQEVQLPKRLASIVRKRLEESPAMSWDRVISGLAAKNAPEDGEEQE